MNTTPTPPQGTGMMTLEQGMNAMKAKMAGTGAKADDLVVSKLNEEGVEITEGEEPEEVESLAPAEEENAENVSDDESVEATEEPDERPVILPDGSQITVEEARKGYLRQADFTRKTQEVARERESLAAREQAAVRELGGLYQQVASLQETEPNWLQLAQDPNVDPKQLQQAQAYWQHKKATLSQAQKVIQETEQRAHKMRVAKAFEVLNSGEYEPTWKDQKALQTGLTAVTNYLTENYQNIPPEYISGVDNPDLIVIADKARRFDELQKAKPKAALAVKGKPAPFKPGAKSTASPQSETVRSLEEVFRKNPTADNAFRLHKAKATLSRR